MHTTPTCLSRRPGAVGGLLGALMAAWLAGCSTTPPPVALEPPAPVAEPAPEPALPPGTRVSQADNPRDYRQDGARHIYEQNSHRIYKGKMPPLLQGVGVMQMDIDDRGQIVSMGWLRPPSHAGARDEIERTARAAAPYPVPLRMGRVTYTDTWLWDKSGQFQLDSLTEGQR
ncbi:MAG: hypothetical protein ACKOXQ_05310 [Hydrogenophaga sp.]